MPKTSFVQYVKPAENELKIQKSAKFSDLYKWQQSQLDRTEKFVLHDGPPYANGEPHMGHVLNKVIKDIVNRYKLMKGYRVEYRPGWDCHGLPIELKACQNLPLDSTPQEVCQVATKFAKDAIKVQMKAFKRWGILGEWDSPYVTMGKVYEAKQIDVFYMMYKQGCIYRGTKPVYWSPSSRTALAEAELEYQQYESPSVYVLFPASFPALPQYTGLSALVWTTTPWTLPANKAICYSPKQRYVIFRQTSKSERLILIGEELLEKLKDILGPGEVLSTVSGEALKGGCYVNPLTPTISRPFLPGSHVTSTDGTGLVHTAPAHGMEDYVIGCKHGLDLDCLVDKGGCYTKDVNDSDLVGKEVLGEGTDAIVSKLLMLDSLLHREAFSHRYPHDWRTKEPIIFRLTEQWFARVSSLKEGVLVALEEVGAIPKTAIRSLQKTLEHRPEWCISRQRVWGVPIPVFFHRETGECLINDETISHISKVFLSKGASAWWALSTKELLPPSLEDSAQCYDKSTDTMDVWFDSGVSWASVLEQSSGQADLYIEGHDQYRGWFQSSLLTSVAAQGKAPFRHLVCHGFVLDKDGKKMSKSLGNVITPDEIIGEYGFGADTMRLWVTSMDYTSDVSISVDMLKEINDSLFKIRNTCRYMLGNLAAADTKPTPSNDLSPLDRYQLHLLYRYCHAMDHLYQNINYLQIFYTIMNFVVHDLSPFYFDIIRDRLYCDGRSYKSRRNALYVLHQTLTHFTMSLAPVLPHLAEEIVQHYNFFECGMYHLHTHVIIVVNNMHGPVMDSNTLGI